MPLASWQSNKKPVVANLWKTFHPTFFLLRKSNLFTCRFFRREWQMLSFYCHPILKMSPKIYFPMFRGSSRFPGKSNLQLATEHWATKWRRQNFWSIIFCPITIRCCELTYKSTSGFESLYFAKWMQLCQRILIFGQCRWSLWRIWRGFNSRWIFIFPLWLDLIHRIATTYEHLGSNYDCYKCLVLQN